MQKITPRTLKQFHLFAPLSLELLREIAVEARVVNYQAKSVVFLQGDPSTTLFLILRGGVNIGQNDGSGGILHLEERKKHQTFGESSMFGETRRRETVTTKEDSEFIMVDRDLMLRIIQKSSAEEILELFSVLGGQIRSERDYENREILSRSAMEAYVEAEKQRALTQMVAGVAHEINTPLGVINTAVSIMARELAEPREITIQRAAEIAESLELIRRNVDRAHQLVQDFKKVAVSQLIAFKETLDISDVIRETINLVSVSLSSNRILIQLKDNLKPGQRKWVGYRGYLSQILINLLTNTERYAYPNETGGVVEVRLDMAGRKEYRLVVRDHGRGISPENVTRIFEPFFTTAPGLGGTGLGLSIVHNLVTNAFKGDIKVKSEPGKGTEFIITLPRVIPD